MAVPWLGIATAGAGILGSMFGGKKKQDDPLAGIRNQLMGLASNVPGMVAQRKQQIGDMFGKQTTTGLQDIKEDVRGTRGFGASSIESRLQNELRESMASGQSQQELAADQWGLSTQANILGQAGGLPFPKEQASPWGGVAELGGKLLGSELGGKIFGQQDEQDTQDAYSGLDLSQRGGVIGSSTQSPSRNEFMDMFK